MKRKIESIMLAACMAMPCLMSLAACGRGIRFFESNASHAHE